MRFEHLVEINDPLNPLLTPLTRAQLWAGLVRRALRPTEFVFGLASAVIHARTALADGEELTRTLDFGAFQVHDRVRLVTGTRSEIATQASDHFPASTMTVFIEEPEPARLFLRFVYESAAVDGAGELDPTTVALRNEAYKSADLDTVQRIRQLADDNAL